MKIGVIGVGNMGGSIIKGLLNHYDYNDVYAENPDNPRVSDFQKQAGFHLVNNLADLPTDFDAIIVTVPAGITIKILQQLRTSSKTVIISAAGGIRINEVQTALPNNPVAEIIPNIPVAVNAGTIGLAYGDSLSSTDKTLVKQVIGNLGDLVIVNESQLPIVGTIVGCGPAFVDVFMDGLGDGAVENGLDRSTAYAAISSMVKGSGELASKTKQTPSDLKDQVTSPGGTTIKGVNELAAHNFKSAIIKAINVANGKM